MRIRRGERIVCLTQQITRRAVERPVLVVGGGEIRFRLLELRRGIGRVDAQRREEVFPHEGGHVLPGDGFDDRARDARAEVGIGVLAAGADVLEIGRRLFIQRNHVAELAGQAGIRRIFVQPRRVAHQHAQGDRRIGIARVARLVAQINADVLVRVEQSVVHHPHQADARDELGDGGAAEIALFRHRHMGRLLLLAVIAFVDDLALLRHQKRAADRLGVPKNPIHLFIKRLRPRRGGDRQKRQQQAGAPDCFDS